MQIPHNVTTTNFLLPDQLDEHPNLHAIINDAERFLLSNKDIVQRAPLQAYASALVFSPYESLIRKENLPHYPTWFKYGPVVEGRWGPVLQTLQGHYSTALASSFDGKYIASLSEYCELLLWDAMTGTLQSTLMEVSSYRFSINTMFKPSRLAFSCNGQLASISSNSEVRVWDPATGVICRNIKHPENWEVVTIAFASDDTLAVSYGGSPPQTWMYKAGAPPVLLETKLTARVLSFLSEGTLALSCSDPEYKKDGILLYNNGEIVLYNPKKRTKRCIPSTGFAMAAFSSNDQLALSAHMFGFIIYDLRKNSNRRFKTGGNVTALAFSSNNRGLFFGCADKSFHYRDLDSGIETVIWTCSAEIHLITPVPNGRLAIAGSGIRILDLQSDSRSSNDDPPNKLASTERKKIWHRLQGSSPKTPALSTPMSLVGSITFSRDGKQFVYASTEGIHVLDSATQREVRFFRRRHVRATAICDIYVASGLSDDPDFLDGTIIVWNLASGQLLKTLNSNLRLICAVAFSPNSKTLLVGGIGGVLERAVNIWDTRTWSLQHTLRAPPEVAEPDSTDYPNSIAFSQNGKRIALLCQHSLSILDAEQYRCLQKVEIRFPQSDICIWWNQISIFVEESYIDTIFGRVYIDQPPDENGLWEAEEPRWKVYDNWLYHDGQKLLWLPNDFRPRYAAWYGDLFVMIHESRKMTFFEINNKDSAPESSYQITAPENGSTPSSKARKYFHHWGKGAGKRKA